MGCARPCCTKVAGPGRADRAAGASKKSGLFVSLFPSTIMHVGMRSSLSGLHTCEVLLAVLMASKQCCHEGMNDVLL